MHISVFSDYYVIISSMEWLIVGLSVDYLISNTSKTIEQNKLHKFFTGDFCCGSQICCCIGHLGSTYLWRVWNSVVRLRFSFVQWPSGIVTCVSDLRKSH